MQGKILLIFIAAFIIISIINDQRSKYEKREKIRENIAGSYGKKPQNQSFERDLIEKDWDFSSLQTASGSRIDDITWDDLEMDQIYCQINHCQSFAGDQILYSILHRIGDQNDTYRSFQEKIEFFDSHPEDRTGIWTIISDLGKARDSYFLPAYLNSLEEFKIPHIEYYRFMRILLFLSVIPAIVKLNYIYLGFTCFIALINIVIYTIQKNRYEMYLNMLGSILGIMKTARQIADSDTLGYENNFRDLKDNLSVFRKLLLKIGKLQLRASSSLSGDLLTMMESSTFGVTLWDFTQYDKVINDLIGHRKELMALYQTLGEIDAAISVASFRASQPVWCTPEFCGENRITAKDIYHPLIHDPIYNSVIIENGCIITGSNASGKSTFIKSLAINALLAQSIHTCMANQFILPHSSVITSMAVRDNVSSGDSYYIREIKYLKRIIQALNEHKPVLCIIDEILRGTNTQERLAASAAIMKYLHKKNCIAVVATHDIELTEMLKEYYDNFHFTERIEDNEISFEYKIHTGPATSKNALKLLAYMEFPDEILKEAEQLSKSNE